MKTTIHKATYSDKEDLMKEIFTDAELLVELSKFTEGPTVFLGPGAHQYAGMIGTIATAIQFSASDEVLTGLIIGLGSREEHPSETCICSALTTFIDDALNHCKEYNFKTTIVHIKSERYYDGSEKFRHYFVEFFIDPELELTKSIPFCEQQQLAVCQLIDQNILRSYLNNGNPMEMLEEALMNAPIELAKATLAILNAKLLNREKREKSEGTHQDDLFNLLFNQLNQSSTQGNAQYNPDKPDESDEPDEPDEPVDFNIPNFDKPDPSHFN
jgi:hypothetical protein